MFHLVDMVEETFRLEDEDELNVCFLLKHNIGDCILHLDRFGLD